MDINTLKGEAKDLKSVTHAIERHVVTCNAETSLRDATLLMQQRHCSSIVITEDLKPIGIWTEADTLQVDFTDPSQADQPIGTLMSRGLLTIEQDLNLDEAALEFKRLGVRHLVVIDEIGNLSGILSQSDVVTHQDAEYFLNMTEVESIMTGVMTPKVDLEASLPEAVQIMKAHNSESLIITESDDPVGLITERDLVRVIAGGNNTAKLEDLMSKPLITVPKNMSLLSARSLMEKRHIRHLGVHNSQNQLLGLISFSDILSNIEHTYVRRLRNALANRAADLQETEQSLHMAHALIDASMDGIMVTNEKGIIQSINPAFTILTGYSELEALGQSASLISSGKHGPEFYQTMWDSINKSGSWQGEIWNRRKNGEIFPEWLTITRIKEPHTQKILYAGIFSDITDRKKSEQIIENLAYFDPLTKLPNRQLLFDRLDVALASAHRDQLQLAIMFIDLDHFKRINDSLGHSFGDQVLCSISDRLKENMREGDTLARIGGDELILLLTELEDPDIAFRASQQIFDTLQQPICIDGHELFVTASIGCAIYPSDGLNREELLKNADTAMYRAKQSGRNAFFLYSSEMNEQSKMRLSMENRLRKSLKNNELFLQYQPKRSLLSSQVSGVEALIRWQDTQMGLVPPDQFIPVAEDIGLIPSIGRWVLLEAACQAVNWLKQGAKSAQVSVNVSPKQLITGDFVADVEMALAESGLPAHCLDLEITESCVIDDVDLVSERLAYLRELGCTVSMDDFGTGYSSLSLLTRLPLDYLKIDRAFIDGIPGEKQKEELVSTIILMAHNLGLQVIAEGVETEEQMEFLEALKCDLIQGYVFSKPVAADTVFKLMESTADSVESE